MKAKELIEALAPYGDLDVKVITLYKGPSWFTEYRTKDIEGVDPVDPDDKAVYVNLMEEE